VSESARARGMWSLFEPVHALLYFTAEGRAAFEAAGLRGFWRGYFAGRAAPLGAVGAPVVTAAFFSFSPVMPARAFPSVWTLIQPAAALATRAEGAATALRRVAADAGVDRAAVAGLADRLWPLTQGLDAAGRMLGAANAALPRPDDPYQALWQATTTLREHRGDGHVAALVAAGLGGAEVLVLRSAADLERGVLQPARGWTDEEWTAAATGLAERGLLHTDPDRSPGTTLEPGQPARTIRLSDEGRRVLRRVERVTDAVATAPWRALADSGELPRVAGDLRRLTLAARRRFPAVNPIGLIEPWDPRTDPDGPAEV
jgi:hypothetical protein